MKDLFINCWKDNIQQNGNQGKLRTLKKIETKFDTEKYIFAMNNLKHRHAVTKLRISAHRLPVEVGRYNNTPYEQRICNHYSLNKVGNEQHYVMECNNAKFITIRALVGQIESRN